MSDTSLTSSSVLGDPSTTQSFKISFALFKITCLLVSLRSSIFSRNTLAEHGPIRSTLSTAAAIIAVDALSKLEGITIFPEVLSSLEWSDISILPILPVFCSSLKSRSGPKRPSV